MRVTSKGQVTIPQGVREKLGILPGTEVDFIIHDDHAELVKTKNKNGNITRGQRIVAGMVGKGTANMGLTTDQLLALTRGWDDIDDPDR